MVKPSAVPFADRLWGGLVERGLLPLGDYVFGQRMMRRLAFLRQAQWWTKGELEAYRDRRLSSLIQIAYDEVPFYRHWMGSAGVKPQEIGSAKDLQKLPIVTKIMLRAGYPDQTTRKSKQRTYEVSSSGSTGSPFCVREDADTAGGYRASFLLMLEWLGWHIGLSHVQTGMTLDRSLNKRLKDTFLRCHYVSAYDLTDRHLDSILDYMDQHQIRFLWGYPGSIYCLAKRSAVRGWNQPLQGIATWGDNLYAHYRKTIERTFKVRVYNQYGCGEGIQVAAQCGHGDHLHVFSPDVIVEYLDGQGRPVSPGQVGNIVLTRLHPGPMPLIRYQVGDIGVSGGDRLCECGRGFEIMESIEGRDTDIVLTPGGNRLIVHFFTGILEFFPEIDLFQVVQEDIQSIDLKIVPRASFSEDVKQRIISKLRQTGADLDIHIQLVDAIPETASGKRRFVINKMQNLRS